VEGDKAYEGGGNGARIEIDKYVERQSERERDRERERE
jgi:hypothetical protein